MASPSGSRTVGTGDHLDREVEVLHHPPDEQQLLGVLLAEVGACRPGSGAAACRPRSARRRSARAGSAPRAPSPSGTGADPHARLAARVDDVRASGAKTRSTPSRRADRQVVVDGARVARQVLARPELQRVEEDRDDDVGRPLAGPADQRRRGPRAARPCVITTATCPGVEGARAARSSARVRATTGPACGTGRRPWTVRSRGLLGCGEDVQQRLGGGGQSRPDASARSAVARAIAT